MTTSTLPATATSLRFHLCLNVSDLPQSVAFFEQILGIGPAKHRPDYAKFELQDPPLVLSLEQRPPAVHGSLNHVGFRFPDSETLVEAQRRLELAGISTQREEGVECCYAKQTKFWVHDVDHRLWEFYLLEDDLEHRGAGQTLEEMVGQDAASKIVPNPDQSLVVYEHFMGQPFTPPSEACDEIRLRGTLNLPLTAPQLAAQLLAAHEHLRPGGKIHLHQLTSDDAVLDETLNLSGPASVVKHVPRRAEILDTLASVGFQQIQLTKFGPKPCFSTGEAELRETIIEARKAPAGCCDGRFDVVYKGPFTTLVDDEGHTYRRGERTEICENTWQALRTVGVADQFTRLATPTGQPVLCGLGGLPS